MKKIIFLTILSVVISCKNKTNKQNNINLDNDFYLELLKYQELYPIPNTEWVKNKYGKLSKPIYIYKVLFALSKTDTVIAITRFSDGIYKNENYYGIYSDDKLKPTVVSNSKYINKKLVKKKSKSNLFDEYINNTEMSYSESFPPTYVYKINQGRINLVKIDTVWSKWD